jgi:hypothetical protein
MDLNKLDRINLLLKNGKEYIGVKMIHGVTKIDTPTLAFEEMSSMVVVNWSDVQIAYFYEGED